MIFSDLFVFFNKLLTTASMLLPHSGEQPKGFVPTTTEISGKKSGDQQRISVKGGESSSAASRNKAGTKTKNSDLVARGSSGTHSPAQAEAQTPRISSETGEVSNRPVDNGDQQSSQSPRPRSPQSGGANTPPQGESSSHPARTNGSEGGGGASSSSHSGGGGGGGGSSSPEAKEGSYLTPEQFAEYQKLREQTSANPSSPDRNLKNDLRSPSRQPINAQTKDLTDEPVFDAKNPSAPLGNRGTVQQKGTPSSRTEKPLESSNSSPAINEPSSTETSLNQPEPTEVHEPATRVAVEKVEEELLGKTRGNPATRNADNAQLLPKESTSSQTESTSTARSALNSMLRSPPKLTPVGKKSQENPLVPASSTQSTVGQKISSISSSVGTSTPKKEELRPVVDIKIPEEVVSAAKALSFDFTKPFKSLDEEQVECARMIVRASASAQKKLDGIDPDKDESSKQEYIRLAQEIYQVDENGKILKKFLQDRYAQSKKNVTQNNQGQKATPQQTPEEMEQNLRELETSMKDISKKEAKALRISDHKTAKKLSIQLEEMKQEQIKLKNSLSARFQESMKKTVNVVAKSPQIQELLLKQKQAVEVERKYFETNLPELLPFFKLLDEKDQVNFRKLKMIVYYDDRSGKQILEERKNEKGRVASLTKEVKVIDTLLDLEADNRQAFYEAVSKYENPYSVLKFAKNYRTYAKYEFPALPPKPVQVIGTDKDEELTEPEEKFDFLAIKNKVSNSPMKKASSPNPKTGPKKGSLKSDHSSVSGKKDDEDLN